MQFWLGLVARNTFHRSSSLPLSKKVFYFPLFAFRISDLNDALAATILCLPLCPLPYLDNSNFSFKLKRASYDWNDGNSGYAINGKRKKGYKR
jgi:hypothetical protein